MSPLPWFQWLNSSPLGAGIRESIWWYPILEGTHTMGTVLVLGTISLVDLRLLGFALRREPVSRVAAGLLPWTWFGFVVQLITGLLLFSSEAVRLYHLAIFWIKMSLVLVGGLNALLFHLTIYRRIAEWDETPVTPRRARAGACVSLCVWVGVVVMGRAMGYA